jgi:hypothetical protein
MRKTKEPLMTRTLSILVVLAALAASAAPASAGINQAHTNHNSFFQEASGFDSERVVVSRASAKAKARFNGNAGDETLAWAKQPKPTPRGLGAANT